MTSWLLLIVLILSTSTETSQPSEFKSYEQVVQIYVKLWNLYCILWHYNWRSHTASWVMWRRVYTSYGEDGAIGRQYIVDSLVWQRESRRNPDTLATSSRNTNAGKTFYRSGSLIGVSRRKSLILGPIVSSNTKCFSYILLMPVGLGLYFSRLPN